MEKALRRQAGADVIRLDTQEAFAHYALREPQQIDFADIEQAAEDAIYTITSLTLTLNGTVVEAACEDCGEDRPHFEITATGQLLELAGDVELGRSGLLRAEVTSWDTDHPLLQVQAWDAEADVIPQAR